MRKSLQGCDRHPIPVSLADEIAKVDQEHLSQLDVAVASLSIIPDSLPAKSASTSTEPSAFAEISKIVYKMFEKIVPEPYLTTIDAQVHKFREEIGETIASLQTILNATKTAELTTELMVGRDRRDKLMLKTVAEQTEKLKKLEADLVERETLLEQNQRQMKDLEDKLMDETSKNQALAELYNSSHASRKRVIEELATVKVTLDRVLEERNRILENMKAGETLEMSKQQENLKATRQSLETPQVAGIGKVL